MIRTNSLKKKTFFLILSSWMFIGTTAYAQTPTSMDGTPQPPIMAQAPPQSDPDETDSQTIISEGEKPERNVGSDYIKQPGRFGIGLSLQMTSPISAKVYIMKNLSVQLAGPLVYIPPFIILSYATFGLNVLYDSPALKTKYVDFALQAGGGAVLSFSNLLADGFTFLPAIQGNFGIQFLFTGAPFDLVFEWIPTYLVNIEQGSLQGLMVPLQYSFAITSRYYF